MIHCTDPLGPGKILCFLILNQEMSPLEKNYASLSSRNYIESLRHWQQCYHRDLTCPICLQKANFPVETNCGHLFCGSCLIEYWKHGSWLGAINCPLCRQKVILLYNISCENQQDKRSKQIVYDIREYNKRFSGQPRPFADYLYDMPLLLNLAIRGIFTLGGLVWIFFLRVVICSFGTIMCLTSPFEMMPEPLCGILGAVDDLVVVFLLLICMINICSQMESGGANLANSTTQNILLES
ncbi:E3 ubiquitin-protein ligase RNF170-like isoform X1 [Eublepharis macularius]|uniref:E3 ubiquitin-protein ligase RNF170-like isoform X1 n=1 Tax=Eublepharis macularius TaxID=481883 RepID=A0AA97L0W4_EUBMA|nr:E3 ubiquitin-protein ligase RNF170-like isoform X1 [Eublepharis macularius]